MPVVIPKMKNYYWFLRLAAEANKHTPNTYPIAPKQAQKTLKKPLQPLFCFFYSYF